MMKKFLLLMFLPVFLIPAISTCGNTNPGEAVTLTVIHINDTHGRTQAEPYISQMAKDLKADGKNVLILDAGDRLHGQTATNLSKGGTMVEIMNEVGYNAMVSGNHDFNFGVDRLIELSGLMDFPLLAANIKDSDGNYLFERYRIFKMNGLTAGVFGIATPETAAKSDPRIVAGLNFENPVETARQMTETLQNAGCTVIIALVHLGDANSTSETRRSDALAAVPGIDLVIDGHSHTRLENGRVIGDTLVTQTGEHAQYIGIAEITLDKRKVAKTARLAAVPVPDSENSLPQDEAVVAKITEGEAKVESVTSVVVGYTPVLLEGRREIVRTRETNLANLICDSMLYATGADIAFLSGGNIRAGIEAGDITMGHVLTVLPFSNLLVTINMKGSDIREILEHGVSSYPEPAGRHIQVGGLYFEFDPSADPLHRVTNARLTNSGELRPDEVYTAATIEFIAAGGDGYTMMEKGTNMVWYQGDAEAFVRYLETGPVIKAGPEGRVIVSKFSLSMP